MNIEIENPGPSLTEEIIAGFEAELGSALPDPYRLFLREYNGGQPWPECIDIAQLPESPTDIQIFFGLGRNIESSDLRWILKTYEGLIQNGRLPIARDSGGNLFCIVLNGPESGKIIYFDISRDTEVTYEVARTFDRFLATIRKL